MTAKEFFEAVDNMRNAQLKYDMHPDEPNRLAKLEAEFIIDLEVQRTKCIKSGIDPTEKLQRVKDYYTNNFKSCK